MTKLEQLLLDQRKAAGPITLKFAEDLLRQSHFDGAITIHYRGGIPMKIELGKPMVLALLPEAPQGAPKEPLDKST